MSRFLISASALGFLAVALACDDPAGKIGSPVFKAGGGKAGETAYPLEVTVGDSPGHAIRSDGYGTYVDGANRVKAVFDRFGNLDFQADADKGKPPSVPRRLLISFGTPVTAGTVSLPPGGLYDGSWNTEGGAQPLQELPVGSSMAINSTLRLSDGPAVGNVFIRWCDPAVKDDPSKCVQPGGPTGQVLVTRTDETTWVIEPQSSVARIRIDSQWAGDVAMPFRMDLRQF